MSGMLLLRAVLILLLLGVVGLFLSLLLGIPILIAALFVLSRRYDWARRLLAGGQQQFARIAREAQHVAQCGHQGPAAMSSAGPHKSTHETGSAKV